MSHHIRLDAVNKDRTQKNQLQKYYNAFKIVWINYIGAVMGERLDKITAFTSVGLIEDGFANEMEKADLDYEDLVVGIAVPDVVTSQRSYFSVSIHWIDGPVKYFLSIDYNGFTIMSVDAHSVEKIVEPFTATIFRF